VRRASGFVGALGVILIAAGCGTGGVSKGGDVSAGKTLFVQKCASCHVLADAGATGTIGPNLDNAFGPSRREGFDESTIQQVVRDQIELASPPMPPNLVRGADADSVAAYVAMCAGWMKSTPCAAGGAPPTTATAPTGTTETTTTGATTGGGGGNGEALYTSLGCNSCHTLDGSASAGPTFKGLASSQVKLDNGQTVTADDAYLLESILDPDKQIVAGFQPGVMSAVIKKGQVSRDDANALVAFIKSVK
jgi:cytochrome c2